MGVHHHYHTASDCSVERRECLSHIVLHNWNSLPTIPLNEEKFLVISNGNPNIFKPFFLKS